MPFDLSSLGFFDGDIFNTVLRDILGVTPKGDPVADTVYLVVLPVLTLFLFSEHVSHLLYIGKSRLKWAFMAIVFFFVIQRGYYPIVAQYSLFAFIILLIWGVWTFITGKKYGEGGAPAKTQNMDVYNMNVPESSSWGVVKENMGAVVKDNLPIIKGMTDKARLEQLERMGKEREILAYYQRKELERKQKGNN